MQARQAGKALGAVVSLIKVDKLPPNAHARYLIHSLLGIHDEGYASRYTYSSELVLSFNRYILLEVAI
jgi:hypothetical protein